MTCCAALDTLLLKHRIVRLDALAPDADPNDERTFLILEGLLVAALLQVNKGPKAHLQSQIEAILAEHKTDLGRLSQAQQTRLGNQIEHALNDYSKQVLPAQQQALHKAMTDIAQRTQTTLAKQAQAAHPLTTFTPTPDPSKNHPLAQLKPVAKPIPAASQTPSWTRTAVAWTEKDAAAMDYLAKSRALYAGKYIDENLVTRARNIITRNYSLYADQPEKVSQRILDGMVSMPDVTDQYWRTVSTNALNHARTYSNLTTMTKMGVSAYVFCAVLDERTTDLCRSLDAKRFPVAPAMERYDKGLESADLTALEEVHPFVASTFDEAGEHTGYTFGKGDNVTQIGLNPDDSYLIAQGICIPPLHFYCRSTIKPE